MTGPVRARLDRLATVSDVVAIEPEPYLRARAAEAAASAPVPVTVIDALAEALPLETASVDAVVCSLVLCTVPNQATALAELRRVLRPGGQVRFLEHVRARSHRAAAQDLLVGTGMWPELNGGCHRSLPHRVEQLTGLPTRHVIATERSAVAR